MTRVYDCFKNNPAKKVAWLEEAPDAPHGAFLGLDRSKNNWMIKGADKWRPFSEVYCPFREGHSRNVNENTYGTSYSCDSQRTVKDYQGKIVRLPEDFVPMEGARYDTSAYFDGSGYLDCGNDRVLRNTDNFSISLKVGEFGKSINNYLFNKATSITNNNSYYVYIRQNTNLLAVRFSSTGNGNTVLFNSQGAVDHGDYVKIEVINQIVHVYINGVEDSSTSDNSKILSSPVFDSAESLLIGAGFDFNQNMNGIITDLKIWRNINTTPELVLDLPLTNNNYTDQTGNNTIINNGVYDVATDVHNTDTHGNVLGNIVYQPEGQATNYSNRPLAQYSVNAVDALSTGTKIDNYSAKTTILVDGSRGDSPYPYAINCQTATKNIGDADFLKCRLKKSTQLSRVRIVAFIEGTFNPQNVVKWEIFENEVLIKTVDTGDGAIELPVSSFATSGELLVKMEYTAQVLNPAIVRMYIYPHGTSPDLYKAGDVVEFGYCDSRPAIPDSYIPTDGTSATRLPGALSVGTDVFNTNKLTIAGTVRWDGQIDGSVTYLVTGTGGYIRYAFASNNFDLFENGTLYRTPVNMDTGEFHVAVVVNETLVKTYINGSLAETFNRVNNPSVFPGVMNIGSTTRTSYVKYLKDFIVNRAALSDNEIQQLYQFSK